MLNTNLLEINFMTLVMVANYKKPLELSSSLIGSEAKNPLPFQGEDSWMDFAGLSWIVDEEREI